MGERAAGGTTERPPGWRQGWLEPRDQRTAAGWLAAVLAGAALWWRAGGGADGAWAPWERAVPLTARYELDVNTATAAELSQLPGIGPTLAARWVAARERHGPFESIEAVSRVGGIGPAKLAQIRGFLTCGSPRGDAAPGNR